jgi:hypothetical protein
MSENLKQAFENMQMNMEIVIDSLAQVADEVGLTDELLELPIYSVEHIAEKVNLFSLVYLKEEWTAIIHCNPMDGVISDYISRGGKTALEASNKAYRAWRESMEGKE